MTDPAALRAAIRSAVYTENRALWLDPEDATAIVDDVLAALASNPPEVDALAKLLNESHYAPDFAPSSILDGRGKPLVTFRNLGANAPQAAALLATLIGATDV